MHTWPLFKKKKLIINILPSQKLTLCGYLCKVVAVWYSCGVWGVGVWV